MKKNHRVKAVFNIGDTVYNRVSGERGTVHCTLGCLRVLWHERKIIRSMKRKGELMTQEQFESLSK